LSPGELFVGDAGFQIRTILGSCVSITLWHPILRIGGMSHFLLPTRGSSPTGQKLDGRYGDEALELMFADLNAHGANPLQCEAKVFGGGNMFPGNTSMPGAQKHWHVTVGRRNGEAARALLQHHGIQAGDRKPVWRGHRQIIFDVSKGDVWSRQVRPSSIEIDAETSAQGKMI
jgi:chemotaxis protein CheD